MALLLAGRMTTARKAARSVVVAGVAMVLLLGQDVGGVADAAPEADRQAVPTIAARPSIVAPDHPITLHGTLPSRRGGELIEIRTKECGQSFFRAFSTTRSDAGGTWSAEFFPGITTQVRASWRGRASRVIVVRQRALLRFAPKASDRTRFVVSVVARAQFWRKSVRIERLERPPGTWRPYRSVRLTTQHSPGTWVWTSGEFTARVPSGTLLRAVLPQAQAGPCYLESTSLTVRTD